MKTVGRRNRVGAHRRLLNDRVNLIANEDVTAPLHQERIGRKGVVQDDRADEFRPVHPRPDRRRPDRFVTRDGRGGDATDGVISIRERDPVVRGHGQPAALRTRRDGDFVRAAAVAVAAAGGRKFRLAVHDVQGHGRGDGRVARRVRDARANEAAALRAEVEQARQFAGGQRVEISVAIEIPFHFEKACGVLRVESLRRIQQNILARPGDHGADADEGLRRLVDRHGRHDGGGGRAPVAEMIQDRDLVTVRLAR